MTTSTPIFLAMAMRVSSPSTPITIEAPRRRPPILAIVFGAAAGERWFRLYSYVTLLTVVLFGAWTGIEAPKSPQMS